MLKLANINKRQEQILSFFEKNDTKLSISQVVDDINKAVQKIARITIIRDLNQLVKNDFLEKIGKGRSVVYQLSSSYQSKKIIDVDGYFAVDQEKRKGKQKFDFAVFDLLKNIFSKDELDELTRLNKIYQNKLIQLSPTELKKEYERLTIELSWKSSKLEGNTYTLLETDYLLREHKEPKGHSHEETTMILNHKKALDFIFSNVKIFNNLTVAKVEDVHYLLTKDLGVKRNIRQRLVRITGTAYAPLDNQFQIKEALEKMCILVNKQKNSFDRAITAMLLIAYIQPFEDGNKRTSRLIGNALLLAGCFCPISFRSVNELEYKKAILLFYEQNNLRYFKELFINQFDFAVKNYFG